MVGGANFSGESLNKNSISLPEFKKKNSEIRRDIFLKTEDFLEIDARLQDRKKFPVLLYCYQFLFLQFPSLNRVRNNFFI